MDKVGKHENAKEFRPSFLNAHTRITHRKVPLKQHTNTEFSSLSHRNADKMISNCQF